MILSNNDILYFLHIPKTAGTSFTKILDSFFEKNFIVSPQSWYALLDNLPQDFSKIQLIRGHYGYGIHRILPKKPIYITMLREPIAHTISWFDHLMLAVQNNNPRIKKFFSGNENLIDVLKNPETKPLFLNIQAQFISIDYDIFSLIEYFSKHDFPDLQPLQKKINLNFFEVRKNNRIQNSELMKIVQCMKGKILEDFHDYKTPEFILPHISEDELLDIAKKRLMEFEFFGLTEKFTDSMKLLCNTFQWKFIPDIPIENVGKHSLNIEELSNDEITEIKKCTTVDFQLYEYAKKIFEERINKTN